MLSAVRPGRSGRSTSIGPNASRHPWHASPARIAGSWHPGRTHSGVSVSAFTAHSGSGDWDQSSALPAQSGQAVVLPSLPMIGESVLVLQKVQVMVFSFVVFIGRPS